MSRQTIQCAATKGPIIYEGDRFKCDTPEEVKAMLEKEGVAVLVNALDAAEIEAMRTGMWDTLEWLTSRRRPWTQPRTFRPRQLDARQHTAHLLLLHFVRRACFPASSRDFHQDCCEASCSSCVYFLVQNSSLINL